MELNREWYTITFAVAPDASGLETEAEHRPLAGARDIFLGDKMKVTLLPNENFDLKPLTPAEQPLGLNRSATWKWNVRPRVGGSFELTANVEVLDSDGRQLDLYTRSVPVRVKVGRYERSTETIKKGSAIGKLLGDLFMSWDKALLALVGLIGTVMLLLWRLGILKKKPTPLESK